MKLIMKRPNYSSRKIGLPGLTFIRSEAITAKIWRFMNPGEKTVPDNVKPDVYNYTRNRDATGSTNITTETSTITPESASGQSQPAPGQSQSALSQPQSASQKLEQYLAGQDPAGRWNAYKVKLAQYEKKRKESRSSVQANPYNCGA
jgi:hypothetical protein